MNPLNYLKHTIMNIEMSCKSAGTHTRQTLHGTLCSLSNRSATTSAAKKEGWGKKKSSSTAGELVKLTRSMRHRTHIALFTYKFTHIIRHFGVFPVKCRNEKIEILFFRLSFARWLRKQNRDFLVFSCRDYDYDVQYMHRDSGDPECVDSKTQTHHAFDFARH